MNLFIPKYFDHDTMFKFVIDTLILIKVFRRHLLNIVYTDKKLSKTALKCIRIF